jgi:predicted lipoprotein with Yx(FWY)xxD motif
MDFDKGSEMSRPASAPGAGPDQRSRAAADRPRRRGRLLRTTTGLALLLALLASTALAAGLALTLRSTASTTLNERVVVSASGRTLYTLSPETSRHLLCKTSECLKRWPPLTVSSSKTMLKAGSGVHGRLGILHRSNGTLQVTLRGLPLYRYSQDHASGDVNGEGIESFGGTWHAMTATSGEHPHRAMTAPAASPPSYPSSTPTTPSITPSPPTTPTSTPTTTPGTPTPPPYPYPYPTY